MSVSTHIWLACFYLPKSLPVDGWHDRKTVSCRPDGSILSRADYDEIIRDGWIYLGHYCPTLGGDDGPIWRKAHV